MYKILSDGYTVNRKIDSTAKPYISISYQKDSLSKDTRFFTASITSKLTHFFTAQNLRFI